MSDSRLSGGAGAEVCVMREGRLERVKGNSRKEHHEMLAVAMQQESSLFERTSNGFADFSRRIKASSRARLHSSEHKLFRFTDEQCFSAEKVFAHDASRK